MAQESHIEWTDATWNPVTGCTKISAGCKNCYADRMAKRLEAMGCSRYRNGFKLTLHEDLVERPLKWRKPRQIFVNSMSDLFHVNVPVPFIQRIFDTMARCPQHTFQILTKRAARLSSVGNKLAWPKNVWIGVSVENGEHVSRIKHLAAVPTRNRFLSIEPLIGPISRLPVSGIGWVIVGGESGPHARPLQAKWVREVKNRCIESDVPFFFKQWGGVQKWKTGRLLDGKTWDEIPSHFNSFPQANNALLVRRDKARSFNGCKSRPAKFAPAGSNRSSRGGNEAAEAFDEKGH
ncbi:DUF5131 family protein [Elusimicrobiota bacterium]